MTVKLQKENNLIALDSFITKENINFCLYNIAREIDLSDDAYTREFSYKLRKINSYINRPPANKRSRLVAIRTLKKSALWFKRKQANINWINPKDSLQSTWISMYLTWTGDSDLRDLLIYEQISLDNLFYAFSKQNQWQYKSRYSILEEMKEDWAESYVNRYKSVIDVNNEKQWQWIFDYLNNKSVLFSSNLFPLPTDKKTMYEYLFSLLALIRIGHIYPLDLNPNLELSNKKKTDTREVIPPKELKVDEPDSNENVKPDKVLTSEEKEQLVIDKFFDNLNKAWKTHLRRSAKKKTSVYDYLPKATVKNLKNLCKEEGLSPEEMIDLLVDSYE